MADNKNKNNAPHGPMGRMMGGEKPKNFKKSLGKLFRYVGSYRYAIFTVMFMAAVSTVFSVAGPKVMGKATTELANGLMSKINGSGSINFEKIAEILLFALGLYITSIVFTFIQGWIMTGITQKVAYKMRREISEKIDRMPMKYFESRPYGDVLSYITNDVDTLGTGLNQSFTMIITSVATIIGTIVMMLTISPLMTLITLCILPVSAVSLGAVIRISQKHFNAQQKYLGKINGMVEENYAGQLVIKAFNKEEDSIAAFDETNETLYKSARKSQFLSGIMMPLMSFVGNLGYVGVAICGGFLAIKGRIGIGDIQAFIQYVRNLTEPMQEIAQVINQVQSMTAAAERVFEFLDEAEEIECKETLKIGESLKGSVDFEHIRFGYNKSEPVIKDFTANMLPGQKIAIVGPTGAGKTTIVKLLMRFYDVDSGVIKLDGVDISKIDRHELRKHFGMVNQDVWLFKGSIMENIRYGRLDASDDEVIEAAKAAHADKFIRTLPGGYQMELNEDATNVSQGQKQLLTIARAILADKRIMILDEATSSVDTRTELLIQKAMDNLMQGRTSFIIAHRLSTIKNADLILVMKNGDIIEQGNHEKLLSEGGFYAELYNSQFEEIDG